MNSRKRDILAWTLSLGMIFNTASPKIKQDPVIMPEKIQVQSLVLKRKGKRMLK